MNEGFEDQEIHHEGTKDTKKSEYDSVSRPVILAEAGIHCEFAWPGSWPIPREVDVVLFRSSLFFVIFVPS
jgi:hypothetical protein